MKILIIGSPGSGKSVLTKKIAQRLNLPAFHLDDYYWKKNWARPAPEEWLSILDTLLYPDEWIIDGNYYDSLERRLKKANLVLYLDFPTKLCLFQALKRNIERILHSYESLPLQIKKDQNYKLKFEINFKFIKLILFFKLKYRKKILTLLRKYNVTYTILKSPREAEHFIQNLSAKDL